MKQTPKPRKAKTEALDRQIERGILAGKSAATLAGELGFDPKASSSRFVRAWERAHGRLEERRAAGGKTRRRRTNVATGKTNAQRRTELHDHKQRRDYNQFRRFQAEINKMCVVLEDFDINDYEVDDDPSLRLTADVHDDLLALQEWLDRQLWSVQSRLREHDLLAKIERLKQTNGRTPEETATALRLAERLQRKLDALLTA